MNITETPQGILLSDLDAFDPAQTLDCGQCFRFAQHDDYWYGIAENRPIVLRQTTDGLLLFSVTREEFDSFWRRYFDFDRDYDAIRRSYQSNDVLSVCAEFAPGIRVLRQNAWEALISFIISQNNNVPRIKGIIDRLCLHFGEPIETPFSSLLGIDNPNGWFGFPSPETLAPLCEEDLAPLRSGWRAGYILDAARRVTDGSLDLENVSHMPLPEARAALQTIRGVGPKVAECVLLYGMGRMEAFPLDVWMKRAMATLFPDLTPASFGETAGIAQQYIFHYCRSNPAHCKVR